MLEVKNLSKVYHSGMNEIHVLKEIQFEIQEGEAICLLGPSGAGKSTLLQILGTLDRPSSGEIFYNGYNIFEMSDDELAKFRNETMGFVFQFHHLIHEMTALENVTLPCMLAGDPQDEAIEKAKRWFSYLGLDERLHHYPNQLSGGELQRVSIARALIKNPKILLADEPTGNLDSENSKKVQDLFFDLHKQLGLTIIVVTHDIEFSKKFSKVYRVQDGMISQLRS